MGVEINFFIRSYKIENPEIFFTAIGTLATAFATIVAFHFGSSSGSEAKDDIIISDPSVSKLNAAAESNTRTVEEIIKQVEKKGSSPVRRSKPKKPLPDPGGTFGLFRTKAPVIMQDLMNDFGLTLDQAGGVLGNFGVECLGFRAMQEVKPVVPGSRGGYGWPMWTGPRRRNFENWCLKNGFDDMSSDDANYGFLKLELETTEKAALSHLRKTQSLRDATRSFMDKFERPSVKHFERRMNWAREAVRAYRMSNS